jgi:hypothetical protein
MHQLSLSLTCNLLLTLVILKLVLTETRARTKNIAVIEKQQDRYIGGTQYLLTDDDLSAAGLAGMLVLVPPWIFSRPEAYNAVDGPPKPPTPEEVALMTAQDFENGFAHKNFFAGKRGGLILESGALDGVQFSVSNFFVKARGWKAIHIEGSPLSFSALAKNRPESLNINAAICSRLSPLHYATGSVGANGGAAGGFWEFMSINMKNAYWPKADVASFPQVPCRPLSAMLALFRISHIDLWVLDLEGAELEALKTFDFVAVTVDVIVVELDGGDEPKDEAVRGFLLDKGYDLFFKHHVRNDWFVRKGFVPVREEEVGSNPALV